MNPRGSGALLFVIGVLLSAALARGAPDARPLYDSLCGGEPYRLLHGGSTPPASIDKTEQVTNGNLPAIVLSTDEQPPQVQVLIQDSALVVPPGATQVLVSIKPVDPPSDLPDGVLGSNVYNVTVATPSGAPVTLKSGLPASVVLRGFGVSGASHINRHPLQGSGWTQLDTTPLGSCQVDIMNANTTEFGLFAVVNPHQSSASPTPIGGGGGIGAGPIAAVAGIVVLGAVVVGGLLLLPRRR